MAPGCTGESMPWRGRRPRRGGPTKTSGGDDSGCVDQSRYARPVVQGADALEIVTAGLLRWGLPRHSHDTYTSVRLPCLRRSATNADIDCAIAVTDRIRHPSASAPFASFPVHPRARTRDGSHARQVFGHSSSSARVGSVAARNGRYADVCPGLASFALPWVAFACSCSLRVRCCPALPWPRRRFLRRAWA